ncbi:MAG: hypothetical protein ACYTGH_18400 [Planctomycetota bacterium]
MLYGQDYILNFYIADGGDRLKFDNAKNPSVAVYATAGNFQTYHAGYDINQVAAYFHALQDPSAPYFATPGFWHNDDRGLSNAYSYDSRANFLFFDSHVGGLSCGEAIDIYGSGLFNTWKKGLWTK